MKKGLLVLFLAFAVTEFLSALHYDPIDFKECSNWDELVPFEHYSEETCKKLVKYNYYGCTDEVNLILFGKHSFFYYPKDNSDDMNNSSDSLEKSSLTRGLLVSSYYPNIKHSNFVDSICLDLDLSSLEQNCFFTHHICCILMNTSEKSKIAVWINITNGYSINKEIVENRFNILQLGDVECTDFLMNNKFFYFIDKKTDAFYCQKLATDLRIELKNEKLAGYEQFEKALFFEERNERGECINLALLYLRVPDTVNDGCNITRSRLLHGPFAEYEEKDIQTFYCAVDEEGKPILETRMYF